MSDSYSDLKDRWGSTKAIGAIALQAFNRWTSNHIAYLFFRPIVSTRTS